MGLVNRPFTVGDIVLHKQWDLCLWEIVDLGERKTALPSNPNGYALLRLLGGHACPQWGTECRPSVDWIVHADERLNEMEILAMASMDCWP